MQPGREVGLEPVLNCVDVLLLQAHHHRARPLAVDELLQRRAPAQRERGPQRLPRYADVTCAQGLPPVRASRAKRRASTSSGSTSNR